MAENRSDSIHVMNSIVEDAIKGVEIPRHIKLDKKEKVFFDLITQAKVEWTKVDIILAVNLARCMSELETHHRLKKKEGDIIENKRGTPIMNPRVTIIEQLTRRSVCLTTKIQVHSAATQGESKLHRQKNTIKRQAIEIMKDEDDGLLARPSH